MCLSAEKVFIETYFCCWKHICCRLGIFFYWSTLEKCYQISRSGPWSRTRGITCCKINETFWRRPLFSNNVFKIFLIHVHLFKFSFLNILNTYRVSSNYFWLHWVLYYGIIVSRIKNKTRNVAKILFSYVNYGILISFSFCVHESRTKDHTCGPKTIEHGHLFTSKIFKFGTWNFMIIMGDVKVSSGSISGSYILIQVQGIQDSNF